MWRKSEWSIVVKKRTNKRSMKKDQAESVERRALAKRNLSDPLVTGTQSPEAAGLVLGGYEGPRNG